MRKPLAERVVETLGSRLARVGDLLDRVAKDPTPKHVHQLRVATRRAQAALDATAPQRGRKLRRKLSKIRRKAGEVRSLDVAIEWLNGRLDYSGGAVAFALGTLCAQRRTEADRLRRWASDKRRARLRAAISDRLDAVSKQVAGRSDAHCVKVLLEAAAAAQEQVLQGAEQASQRPSVEATHTVRLAVKRLRYLAAFVLEAAGENEPRASALNELAELQEAMGQRCDAAERAALLRAVGLQAAQAGAAQRLVEELERWLGGLEEQSAPTLREALDQWPCWVQRLQSAAKAVRSSLEQALQGGAALDHDGACAMAVEQQGA